MIHKNLVKLHHIRDNTKELNNKYANIQSIYPYQILLNILSDSFINAKNRGHNMPQFLKITQL